MSLRLAAIGLMLLATAAIGVIAFQYAQAPKLAVTYNQNAPVPVPLTASYMVAAHTLQAGTLARDEDFNAKPLDPAALPEAVVAAGLIPDSPEERTAIRGALVRRYIDVGQPVTRADVLRPRDRGFLAAVLAPGTRAVSVGVDAVTGVSGLIWPGDRVDVILSQQVDAQNSSLARRVFSETVATDVRVIGVDQDITQGASSASGVASGVAGKVARTITLQVTPDQAARLVVAERLGKLALAIRAINDATAVPTAPDNPTVFGEDVSPALARVGDPVGGRIQVIQGNERSEVDFK